MSNQGNNQAGNIREKIKGKPSKFKTFHDTVVNVYEVELAISDIHFWKDNARTLLDFDILLRNKNKQSIEDVSEEEVLDFLYKERKRLKLAELMESIRHNGVKTPIIVTDSARLLDGNRRFFACKLLEKKEPDNAFLEHIPAYVVEEKDITVEVEQKILAEANFVDDNKVPWPLDVKAKVVAEAVGVYTRQGMNENDAMKEVSKLYGIKRQVVVDYIKAKELADEFISQAEGDEDEMNRKEIINKRFVYFWEFLNKAMRGPRPIKGDDLEEAKNAFSELMSSERIRNLKHVEPIARASAVGLNDFRNKVLTGDRIIDDLDILYREAKNLKNKVDKAISFRMWLTALKYSDMTDELRKELVNVCKVINKKLEK